jgi:lysozyme
MSAADLIKRFEGYRDKAYQDSAGIWTIGYGTTVYPDGKHVQKGETCTQEQAEEYLLHDSAWAVSCVMNNVRVPLTNSQKDALISFVYNVGCSAFQKSTLLRLLNAGNYDDAAKQFPRWNKAGGVVLDGLTKRRKAEMALFLSGTNINPEPYPQEKQMLPFLAAAIPTLISSIPEFAKIFSKPEVAERNIEAVQKASELIISATGSPNLQAAVEAVQNDPEAATKANDALRVNRAEIMDMIERLNAIEQGNINSAREFNRAEPNVVGQFKFVHLLSLVLIAFSGAGGVFVITGQFPAELKGGVVTLMLIGGWTAVVNYWLGSSSGSDRKTDALMKKE